MSQVSEGAGEPTMLPTEPHRFAQDWIGAWNDLDVEAALAFYAEDVVFTSPTALRFAPGSGGVLRGKPALREYWTTALAANQDLRFELLGTYVGIDTVVLNYADQTGRLVNEVMRFRDGLVAAGHATHVSAPPSPAS